MCRAFTASVILATSLVLPLAAAERADDGRPQQFENLAAGRPYTLDPRPSYRLCTDPGDRTQLTDGQYTNGYFWTQAGTVGWNHARPVIISIDLGSDQPIRGLSFNTAAGVAGVEWPASIFVLISVDGRAYHDLGDLVALSRQQAAPPEGKYAVHRFQTDQLRTHGRYVKLVIDPAGPFCFVDEIEVFRGDAAFSKLRLPGTEIRDAREYFADTILNASVKRRIGQDLETARAAVLAARIPGALKSRLMGEVTALQHAIEALPPVDGESFQAVFPMNSIHARTFALHGAVRAALGKPPLVPWRANPWDFLAPTDLPDPPPRAELAIAAMRNESRAGAVNLTNCTEQAITARLRFEELPGGSVPPYITVHEVAWTDTREGTPVAAALPEIAPRDGACRIRVPAGMTRQVWFTFTPHRLDAGVHCGQIVVENPESGPLRIPVRLRVFDLDFPAEPTLHVGGWDYTDAGGRYGVTPENRAALIAHLRSHYVDSPWATSGVMPFGQFDEQGNYSNLPDTARFDTWLTLWPGARRYCVFVAVGNQIAGTRVEESLFAKKVSQWIRFWAEYARSKQLRTDQLVILLLDEPHENSQDQIITAWARAIRAAEPEVVLWEDPTYRDPTEATPEMMAAVDVLCPNRPMMLAQGKPFADFYRQQREAGRRLDLYSCSGPARLLDPYTYHRLQAWSCFDLDAESSFFWAFGDTGGGDSWNEYSNQRTSYTPLFLGADTVTAGKHMEAIRESAGDFEYLTMLRRHVELLARQAPESPSLARARELLLSAPRRVLDAPGATELSWRTAKDRTLADQVRIQIAELLEQQASISRGSVSP